MKRWEFQMKRCLSIRFEDEAIRISEKQCISRLQVFQSWNKRTLYWSANTYLYADQRKIQISRCFDILVVLASSPNRHITKFLRCCGMNGRSGEIRKKIWSERNQRYKRSAGTDRSRGTAGSEGGARKFADQVPGGVLSAVKTDSFASEQPRDFEVAIDLLRGDFRSREVEPVPRVVIRCQKKSWANPSSLGNQITLQVHNPLSSNWIAILVSTRYSDIYQDQSRCGKVDKFERGLQRFSITHKLERDGTK